MPRQTSRGHVFVNCPFDATYDDQFRAIIFTVIRCGFQVRCARELEDSGTVRIGKILDIIDECPLGIHDISFTELDTATGLPRFNMPLELGLDLGARRFGNADHAGKKILIMDREAFRYEKFISDIKGQDVEAHDGTVPGTIGCVRKFLNNHVRNRFHDEPPVPAVKIIEAEYEDFTGNLPVACANAELDPDNLDYSDYLWLVSAWLTPSTS